MAFRKAENKSVPFSRQPDPRRCHLCGGGAAAGTGWSVPHSGKAFLAGALFHLPGGPGQKAVRALQRPAHRDRCHGRGLWRVRPGARVLPAGNADPLQPGDQERAGAQGSGHHSRRAYRVGCRLERYRRGLPDDQTRRHSQRPDHLQRIPDRGHRPRRYRLGGDACPGERTPQFQQTAQKPLVDRRRP